MMIHEYKRTMQLNKLDFLSTVGWKKAVGNGPQIRRTGLDLLGYKDSEAFLDANRSRIGFVALLAGASSRWVKSIQAQHNIGQSLDIDIDKPRCLANVPDVLHEGETIPIGAYTVRALQGLGKMFIVWGTYPISIENMVKGCGVDDATYVQQKIYPGQIKPLGHGDALIQTWDHFSCGIEYLVTCFGGDAQNRETILTSLIVFMALQKLDENRRPHALIPSTYMHMDEPKYPILLNESGFPSSFVQPKLQGINLPAGHYLTNVGVRMYRTADIAGLIEKYRSTYIEGTGYNIPENAKGDIHECALDNFDGALTPSEGEKLAGGGRIRTLAISYNGEISSSVKDHSGINGFLDVQREFLRRKQ